jgi:ketosteroid isomerase-like protein
MAEEAIERLRAGLDAFNRTGEIDADLFDPEVEMIQASSIIDTAGEFQGPDGLVAALGELRGAFDDLRFELEDVSEAPDGRFVEVIRVRGRGKGSGLEMDNRIAWLVTLREGKISRLVVYEEPAEAFDAVGIPGRLP